MGLRLTTASQQALVTTTPGVATYPVTLMCWACPLTGTSDSSMVMFGQTGNVGVWMGIDFAVASGFFLPCSNGTTSNDTAFIAHALGRWDFLVARCISATNRRLSVLTSQGIITHVQSTTNITPTLNRLTIGKFGTTDNSGFFTGMIAEVTIVGADIQPGGAQTENWFLRKLAYEGPFAFPSLLDDIIEYRSFRSVSVTENEAETWFGRRGRQTWSGVLNIPAIGPHPQLLGTYRRPPLYGSASPMMV